MEYHGLALPSLVIVIHFIDPNLVCSKSFKNMHITLLSIAIVPVGGPERERETEPDNPTPGQRTLAGGAGGVQVRLGELLVQ